MQQSLVRIALVVREYDEAIAFYTGVLGFDLIEDTLISEENRPEQNKRWVVVAPKGCARNADSAGARRWRRAVVAHRQSDRRPRIPVSAHRRFLARLSGLPIARRRVHPRTEGRALRNGGRVPRSVR